MNTNLLLLGITFVFGCLLLLFGYSRWRYLHVADIYVLMVGAFFIVYTFLDALVNDLSIFNPVGSILTIFLVYITTLVTWVVLQMMPKKIFRIFRIRNLLVQWTLVDRYFILLLFWGCILIFLYGYYRFGIITHIASTDLDKLGISLPYWFTSVRVFLQPLAFIVFVVSTAKLLSDKGLLRWLWTTVLLVDSAIIVTSGRRALFFVLVMFAILLLAKTGKNVFSGKGISIVVVFFLLLVVFSSLYQNHRDNLSLSRGYQQYEDVSFINAALDVRATLSNLKIRQSMWKFNYMILDSQDGMNKSKLPYGSILWQAVQNSTPSILWDNKVIYDIDEMTATFYGLPVQDYPTNIFAITQADFGFLSAVIIPLQMFMIYLVIGTIAGLVKKHSALFLLVTGYFIHFILNIEYGYSAPILLFRDIGLFVIVYYFLYFIVGALKELVTIGMARR